jgi:hypothetical protein
MAEAAGVGDVVAYRTGGVDDGAEPGRGVQGAVVQRRAAPAGDEEFGAGEGAASGGGGEVVEDEARIEVDECGEPVQRTGAEHLAGGALRHGQGGARTGTGLLLRCDHLTLPAVSPDFQ